MRVEANECRVRGRERERGKRCSELESCASSVPQCFQSNAANGVARSFELRCLNYGDGAYEQQRRRALACSFSKALTNFCKVLLKRPNIKSTLAAPTRCEER